VCSVDANGALTGCTDSGASSSGLISGGNQGFIATYGQYFYVTLGSVNTVLMCTIDPASGQLSACTYTGGFILYASGIVISAAGDYAYVTSYNNAQIFACPRDPTTGLFSLCTPQLTSPLASPAGLTVDATGSYGYVVYDGSNVVGKYSGNFDQTISPVTTPTGTANPSGVVFTQGYLYVTFPSAGTVEGYVVNGQTGGLTPLGVVAASGLEGPVGITAFGGDVYVAARFSGTVYICKIQSDGTLNCTVTATGFNIPIGIAMSAF
jgi:6-phosphogluconolactonase (cycloisomerase 2 family)